MHVPQVAAGRSQTHTTLGSAGLAWEVFVLHRVRCAVRTSSVGLWRVSSTAVRRESSFSRASNPADMHHQGSVLMSTHTHTHLQHHVTALGGVYGEIVDCTGRVRRPQYVCQRTSAVVPLLDVIAAAALAGCLRGPTPRRLCRHHVQAQPRPVALQQQAAGPACSHTHRENVRDGEGENQSCFPCCTDEYNHYS
jgi:hypothetical protein